MSLPHVRPATSRRDFLLRAGGGFGALAAAYLLGRDGALGATGAVQPAFPRKAKSVIWLFMEGGPSHLDLFDPKPTLQKLAGKPMPESFGKVITAMGTGSNALMPSQRTFKQHGQSGIWVSDWLPHLAEHADELAVIRSCWADGLNHVGSVCQMNTGSILAGRPALGAWTLYGLGSANQNLPAFVIMTDGPEVVGGPKNWSSGFLPGSFQGTLFRSDGPPIFDVTPPKQISLEQQRSKLDLLAGLNRLYAADKQD